jgi:hypothetical protein
MTENDWLTCKQPKPMLEFWMGKSSERKLRLFACACVRRFAQLHNDKRRLLAVQMAERYADIASDGGAWAAFVSASKASRDAIGLAVAMDQKGSRWPIFAYADGSLAGPNDRNWLEQTIWGVGKLIPWRTAEEGRQADSLRDLFGPQPFGRLLVDQNWLTWNNGKVPKLAKAIYDERRFEDLPILADVLEFAGCRSPDVLVHCRESWPHVRGCWVLDLLRNPPPSFNDPYSPGKS